MCVLPAALADQLRRRREAALRLVPLDGGFVRDPLAAVAPRPRTPSAFGLSPTELITEAWRLRDSGWQGWEIAATLVRPSELGVAS
jgi:hypothetical protein